LGLALLLILDERYKAPFKFKRLSLRRSGDLGYIALFKAKTKLDATPQLYYKA
jgi:hypothetical protein